MKKRTNWERYYKEQINDPTMRRLVDEELKTLRIGVQLARLREGAGLTQTQLAAKVGMSAPNISRIETSPAQNLTLGTLVDRKSTRLNSSHTVISYAVFCLKKKINL